MKAILMVAGVGSRISKYINQRAKCLVDIGGISLIRNTVLMLLNNNIEVNLVMGYKKDDVIDELKGLDVNFYYNPFYEVTNSICSLWFAREQLGIDDVIIANGDVFWETGILNDLLEEKKDVLMLSDSSKGIEGDYLFNYSDGKLHKYGKDLSEADVTGEYVGIAKINKSFQKDFLSRMNSLVWSKQHNLWWENVIYSFIPERDIYVKDITGKFWAEVDTIEDYHKILDYRKQNDKNNSLHFPIDFADKGVLPNEIRNGLLQNKL